MKITWLAFATLMLGVLFTACNKDDNNDADLQTPQYVASEDQTTATDLFEDVDNEVDGAIETRGSSTSTCPVITVVPTDGSYPRTVTLDYGDTGCEGPNGRIRKGQIVVNLTDTLSNEGAVRTVNLVNFYVDDAHIEGTKTLVNQGFNTESNVTFTRSVTGGKITFPSDATITWESNHTLTQIEGGTTNVLLDNVFEINGGSSGVNRNGKAFTGAITEPLLKKRACPWIVSGVWTLSVEDKTVSIDYGSGNCDKQAVVTLPNGSQHSINIRRWW